MFQVHQIYVKRDPNSKIDFRKLEKIVKEKLCRDISKTKISTTQEDLRLKIILKYPFYLKFYNEILEVFNQDGRAIKKIIWEEKGSGDLKIGVLELTVS